MRRLFALLALSSTIPASAETLDCAVLKSTMNSFELAMDSTMKKANEDPNTRQTRRQVRRKAGETTVYDIFTSPDVFLRRTYNANSFITETYFSREKVRRKASYSIDPAVDYFALGKPFDFNLSMKEDDGKVDSTLTTTVSFNGTIDFELGGCTYTLTKIVETNHGTNNDKPFDNRTEAWYSRDLKTSLYSRAENSDGSVLEVRARDITTMLTPVD
jgi:hypothetical protein